MAPPKRKLVTFLLPIYAFAGFCIVVSIAAAQDALRSTGVASALWFLGALALAVIALISGWFAVLGTKHWKDLPNDERLARGATGLRSTPSRAPLEPDTRQVGVARVITWSALAVVVALNVAEALLGVSGSWWYALRLAAGVIFLGAFTFRAQLWIRQRRANPPDNA
jgi:hypothetical protein